MNVTKFSTVRFTLVPFLRQRLHAAAGMVLVEHPEHVVRVAKAIEEPAQPAKSQQQIHNLPP